MTLPTSVADWHLYAQQGEPRAVRRGRLERHLGKAQKAGRIGGAGEGLDKGGFDQVEIGLSGVVVRAGAVSCAGIEMRLLPLHNPLRRRRMVVAGTERIASAPPKS